VPLAPRRSRDRKPSFLWLVQSNANPITTFAGPKYRKPKMASYDLRTRSFEDDYLCGILHGPLQLQIWTAFLLPACLFPYRSTPIAHTSSHTSFSQLSEPTQGSSSPARFCSHFQLVSRLYIAILPLLAFVLTSAGGLPSL
jgi:hypothetical protein